MHTWVRFAQNREAHSYCTDLGVGRGGGGQTEGCEKRARRHKVAVTVESRSSLACDVRKRGSFLAVLDETTEDASFLAGTSWEDNDWADENCALPLSSVNSFPSQFVEAIFLLHFFNAKSARAICLGLQGTLRYGRGQRS